MKIAMIVAVDEQGVIGKDNDLPWRLPDDLKWFKRVTMGKPLIMGRRTHESIGRALPGRLNVVLSRQPGFLAEGCVVVQDMDAALAAILAHHGDDNPVDEVVIIGGAGIYEAFMPDAERLYLTRVHATVEGDVRFPKWDPSQWRVVESETHDADARHAHAFTWTTLERVRS